MINVDKIAEKVANEPLEDEPSEPLPATSEIGSEENSHEISKHRKKWIWPPKREVLIPR